MKGKARKRPARADRPGRPAGNGKTREKILSVAESSFAEFGYAGTSLHDIAHRAGFTTALLNYYFGTKEKLFTEIFLRRGRPICTERMERLRILKDEKAGAITVEDLVHAYVIPLLKIARGAGVRRFLQIHARLHMEPQPFALTLRGKVYDESTRAYAEALHQVLPHLSLKTVYWRLILIVGANLYAMSDTNRITKLSGGACNPHDLDEMYEHVVGFLVAGLRAPTQDQLPRYAFSREGLARKVAARSSARTRPEPST